MDTMLATFGEQGYAILGGCFEADQLDAVLNELETLQHRLLAGDLPRACGSVVLDDPDAQIDGKPFAHYVCEVTRFAPLTRRAVMHPRIVDTVRQLLGPRCWLLEDDRLGVVYQDARPGPGSGYSRIGWHADAQSGPTLDWWPSVAFTIHLDATSPENGFLRVVPGSHRGGTQGMPAGFERVPGEVGVYCERGDVLLHHSDLWHSAARATEDPPGGVRRHVRGGWYGGARPPGRHGVDDFVKNARR